MDTVFSKYYYPVPQSSVNSDSLLRKWNPKHAVNVKLSTLCWATSLLFLLRDHSYQESLRKMELQYKNEMSECKQEPVYFPDWQLCVYKRCNSFSQLWIIFVQIAYFPIIVAKFFLFQDTSKGPQSDVNLMLLIC